MGRQLVTLALGLTLLGLGRFNDQDQEIIIRQIFGLNAKIQEMQPAGQTMQSPA